MAIHRNRFRKVFAHSPELPEMPPLRSPQMAPDERAIPIGIEMLVGGCLDFLTGIKCGLLQVFYFDDIVGYVLVVDIGTFYLFNVADNTDRDRQDHHFIK